MNKIMSNITEKYNGKNGNEGDVLYFIITDYHIDLKNETILVKYEMVSNNLLDNYEKSRVKKSYVLQDEIEMSTMIEVIVEEAVYSEEGELISEAVFGEVEEITRKENLAFSDYQNFALQYGVDNSMNTLEDVFFVNTTKHILYIHGYSEEDLFVKNTEES